MDWKVFASTFGVLFLAELGDKTQFAVITMASQTARPFWVFLGAATALSLVTLLGVVFGYLVHEWVPTTILRKVAASVFVGIGLVMFFGRF